VSTRHRLLVVAAAGLVAVVVLLAVARQHAVRPVSQRVDPEENEATRLTSLGVCGVERWAVKTLTDPAASMVRLVARRSTVRALNVLPAPALPDNNTTRLPVERQSYRVTATLVKYKLESDQDIHLVLAGGGKTMIAEMPSANCDRGARARQAMLVARQKLESRYGPASDQWTYVGQRATLTGVRFFDFKHGQTGVADNAVELHPVFGFKP
jgi:hypothetical protein